MEHTSGPWLVHTYGRLIHVVNQDQFGVAEVLRNTDGPAAEDKLALSNARLIAASPDMYIALHDVDDTKVPLHKTLRDLASLLEEANFDDTSWIDYLRRQANAVEAALGEKG